MVMVWHQAISDHGDGVQAQVLLHTLYEKVIVFLAYKNGLLANTPIVNMVVMSREVLHI
jgi:hypothetical protein